MVENSSFQKALTFFGVFGVLFTAFSGVALHFSHTPFTGILLVILLFFQILFVLFSAFLRASFSLFLFPLFLTAIVGSIFSIGYAVFFALGIPLSLLYLSVRDIRKNRIHLSIITEVRRPLTHFFLISGFFACFLFSSSIFQILLPPFVQLVNHHMEPLRLSAEKTLAEIDQTFESARIECGGNAECEAMLSKEYESARASLAEKTDFFVTPSPQEFEQKLRKSETVAQIESRGIPFETFVALLLFLLLSPLAPFLSLFLSFLVSFFFFLFRLFGVFSLEYKNVPQAHII